MTLRTGVELITLTLLINKISGLYGLLALLTGFHLSPLQLSMYIYSLLALGCTAYLAPHIKRQSPLQCLALAWLYLLDSVVNAAYTAAFGMAWFLLVARKIAPDVHGGGNNSTTVTTLPGAKTMDDTAGFTSPKYDNVSAVSVVDGALIAHPASGGNATTPPGGALNEALFQSGSVASITVISALWAIRIYFILIVAAYARGVLRAHIVAMSQSYAVGPMKDANEDPFAVGKEAGLGWQGKLGRLMVRFGRSYWLGADEEGEGVRSVSGRFRGGAAGKTVVADQQADFVPPPGVFERERRRRAGTGPPKLVIKASQLEPGDDNL